MNVIKLKPAFISFVFRYFIFTYFLLIALFSIWMKSHVSPMWYMGLWIFLTIFPALILSFKRVRLGWFFWIGLLDIIAFSPKFKIVYKKLLSFSNNPLYQKTINSLHRSSEVEIYIAVGLIGIIITQLYRMSFVYTIDNNLRVVSIKGGLFARSERRILVNHITDVSINRNFFQRILGIGSVVPITSSSMGMGSKEVFGGGNVSSKNGIGAFIGSGKSENTVNTENPMYVIYGVKHPKKVANEIISLIASGR